LIASGLLSQSYAAEIDNGTPANFVLGSSGTMDSDFIFSFCPTNSPNCLPSPVSLTSARVNVAVQNSITNVQVELSVLGPGAFSPIACSGPTTANVGGANFNCLFPTTLFDTQTIGTQSHFTFTPTVTFTPNGSQNASLRFFVQAEASAVPEPASLALVGGALAALMARRRLRCRA
jgi:hypothetical protein